MKWKSSSERDVNGRRKLWIIVKRGMKRIKDEQFVFFYANEPIKLNETSDFFVL